MSMRALVHTAKASQTYARNSKGEEKYTTFIQSIDNLGQDWGKDPLIVVTDMNGSEVMFPKANS